MATVNNSVTQNKERYWYPLITVPEFLAVLLYAIPGLVPPRTGSEHRSKQEDAENQSTGTHAPSNLSVSSRGADPETTKPSRRESDETEVENTSLALEKKRDSKFDSKSEADTVVFVSPEKDSISEREQGQSTNSTTPGD